MVGLMTLKVRSGSVSVGSLGSGVHKVLFEPFKGLWWVWGLNLNVIFPSYNLVGASPLPLDIEYLFGVIQHSAVDVGVESPARLAPCPRPSRENCALRK